MLQCTWKYTIPTCLYNFLLLSHVAMLVLVNNYNMLIYVAVHEQVRHSPVQYSYVLSHVATHVLLRNSHVLIYVAVQVVVHNSYVSF